MCRHGNCSSYSVWEEALFLLIPVSLLLAELDAPTHSRNRNSAFQARLSSVKERKECLASTYSIGGRISANIWMFIMSLDILE